MSAEVSDDSREVVAAAIARLWWLPLLRGILLLLLGAYALFQPGMTIAVLAQVIGIFVIVEGLLCIVASIVGEVPSRFWLIVRGVVEILVGLFVFANPILVAGVTATILIYLLAFSAILSGVLEIVAAIQDRQRIQGEGWFILGGALTVLFGVVVLIAPLAFGLFMVRLLGVFAIIGGVSLMVFAFRLRRVGKLLQS